MNYACWDEKAVVHVAAATVVPPAVIAHLGLAVRETNRSLAPCARQKTDYDCCWTLNSEEQGYTALKFNDVCSREKLQPAHGSLCPLLPSLRVWTPSPPEGQTLCHLTRTLFLVFSDSLSFAHGYQGAVSPQLYLYFHTFLFRN